MIDFHTIDWLRRETKYVTEYKAKVGDLCVFHEYNWNVQKTLRSTLEKELDLETTEILPWPNQLADDEIWKPGYSENNHNPTVETEALKDSIKKILRNANLLQYKSISEALATTAEPSIIVPCDECGCAPCIWQENKVHIETDNNFLLSDATNKQRRFYAYKQMVYALYSHLGRGNRRELPSCVVEGVRGLWPEDNKRKYIGFKDK